MKMIEKALEIESDRKASLPERDIVILKCPSDYGMIDDLRLCFKIDKYGKTKNECSKCWEREVEWMD